MIVYVSIGNSDDKLSQAEWAAFYRDVCLAIRFESDIHGKPVIHGQWVSEPASAWQNACWCVELNFRLQHRLRQVLSLIAREYRQDTIAWAEAKTEFIKAAV